MKLIHSYGQVALLMLFVLTHTAIVHAQAPRSYSASDLYEMAEKLNVLGSVLYVAAHPDDENTRMISYFANDRKMRTAYLSMTRGDGGQNLIGTEIWEKLGLIRTHELLQARHTDGGIQYFTRANDFGFSKHPDETLSFWQKDEVMHDIVKVIREFQPDVIINRFDHRTPGRTHGHHTSSAILGLEAFDMSGRTDYMPDRLGHLSPWQAERIFFNTSWWFYGSREGFAEADKTNLFSIDAGVYYPVSGISNTEIAARSRSMHKSQGFGSTGTRGSEIEYLELLKGSRPGNKENPLDGINTSWSRIPGGAPTGTLVDQLIGSFDFIDPSQNLSQLIQIYKAISALPDGHWKKIKLAETQDLITACAGLYLEAKSETPYATRGSTVEIEIEAINRSSADMTISDIRVSGAPVDLGGSSSLLPNEGLVFRHNITIDRTQAYSNPYWLTTTGSIGMYSVDDPSIIGQPKNPADYSVTFDLMIEGQLFTIKRDLIYKTTDPVKGEVDSPFYIKPAASVSFSDPIYLLADDAAKQVTIHVKAYQDGVKGQVQIEAPQGWKIAPQSYEVDLQRSEEEGIYTFSVTGPGTASSAELKARLNLVDGTICQQSVTEITYDHIPAQVILYPATAKAERIDLDIRGRRIAYLQGAGDDIPKSLRQIGYDVTEITVADVIPQSLDSYDALVIGIRAYNTISELQLKKSILQDYMVQGGTIIVQYNTNRGVKGDDIGPYPMELSRERVTDELAEVTLRLPDHKVLSFPNRITSKDFEGWVQERGLYFPNKWDERYAAPLSCSDQGEDPLDGGLLVAEVGKGHFIYTGYSWFRQLPGGVPGAFRIFANMLSIGAADGQSSPSGSN